jgi:hypothetical protein
MTTIATIEDLISTLKAIDTSIEIPSILTEEQTECGYQFNDLHPLVQYASSLGNELLIDDKGQCDWGNISIMKQHGFHVKAGESDSFGWLTGLITTSKGDILYG